MTRTAFITGVTGFVGSHLAEQLLADGWVVAGMSRSATWCPGAEHLASRVEVDPLDLRDTSALQNRLRETRPAWIIHLAGQANVPAALQDPAGTWRVNVEGSRSLFMAAARAAPLARLLHVGTGQVYGLPSPAALPLRETSPLQPANPYAQSKAAADAVALELVRQPGLLVIVARSFNHIGPRQQDSFAVASFAHQIARFEWEAERGRAGPARPRVGRLDVARDFMAVQDVVRAYRLLLEHGRVGEIYNVASGVSLVLRHLLDQLLALARIPIEIIADPSLMRGNDPDRLEASIEKLHRDTGFVPQMPLVETLQNVLDYWRWRVRRPAA